MGKKLLLVCALALITTGCATGYQTNGFGGGFSEMPMAADTYRITFRGNAFTSPEETQEMSLLRAAELAINHGYSHFVVLGAGNSTSTSYVVQPGQTVTNLNPNGFGGYTATSNTYGGYAAPIHKPRAEIIVKFVQPDQGGLDAGQVLATLGPRYGR